MLSMNPWHTLLLPGDRSACRRRITWSGCIAVALLLLLNAFAASAATPRVLYETGFETAEGFDASLTLVGQGGWVGNGAAGNGLISGFLEGRGQHAFVGFSATTNDTLVVWRPVNYEPGTTATNPPVVRFSVLMAIEDSATSTNRDDFRWSVYNIRGDRLFSVDFDNDALQINYLLDDDKFVDTGVTFTNSTPLRLEIAMNFATNKWSATLNGAVLTRDLPITKSGLPRDFGDVDAVWAIRKVGKPGDNFMVFDDYRVVAEAAPSTNQPPRVEAGGMLAPGQFLVRCYGTPGKLYALEGTSDFNAWLGLKTNAMPADGYFEHLDRGAPAWRFYRAAER